MAVDAEYVQPHPIFSAGSSRVAQIFQRCLTMRTAACAVLAPPRQGMITMVSDQLELFAQVDVNGDNTLEWEEFTGFVIDQVGPAHVMFTFVACHFR
jgi:hypothetical protein